MFLKCRITAISDKWLAQEMANFISTPLCSAMYGIVIDHDAANVNAFEKLHSRFHVDGNLFMCYPDNQEKYLFAEK